MLKSHHMIVRTRMAPSPTGEYHIGHIRTLLYNYAFAKKNNGKFIIRIEDTDRERFVEGAVERILKIVRDYGFEWDEGPEVGGIHAPYIQSERLDLYKKYAEELVEKGHAYYCFCSSERLEKLREEQRGRGLPTTKYDRHCLNLSADEVKKNIQEGKKYVIRLKVPENETISFVDQILGDVKINSNDLDDQVLLKTDGFPTYHLAVVIDDHFMEITHIMRGIDWLPSTPKHVLLYKYFGWDLPNFVHLPNLKELGGNQKLSKRYGAVAAIEFLQEGYLPEALVNFLMFLGWNPGGEKEIYTMEEFIKEFSIERIHKTDLVAFDRQKLLWMNGYYIRNLSNENLLKTLKNWSKKFEIVLKIESKSQEYTLKVISLIKDRLKTLNEFNFLTSYFYEKPIPEKSLIISYAKDESKAKEILNSFLVEYAKVEDKDWTVAGLETINHNILNEKGFSPKEAFMTLRAAVTGSTATPSLVEILELIGKEETVSRIEEAFSA